MTPPEPKTPPKTRWMLLAVLGVVLILPTIGVATALSYEPVERTHAFVVEQGRQPHLLPGLGGTHTFAFDVNDSGWIVGQASLPDGDLHAFLFRDGVTKDLGTLGGACSSAEAVNDAGQVVGSAETAWGEMHAFLWEDGRMRDLGSAGTRSVAHDINDLGQVVGERWEGGTATWGDGSTRAEAVRWDAGRLTVLPTLGGASGCVLGINDLGTMVGWTTSPDDQDPRPRFVVWAGGAILDLGGIPEGINNRGQVLINRGVGPAGGQYQPLLWEDGRFTALEGAEGSSTRGWALNDGGDVLCWTTDDGLHGEYVLWSDGAWTDVGLGSEDSQPMAMNDAGQVVGFRNH